MWSVLLFIVLVLPRASAQGSDCGVFPFKAIYLEGLGSGGLGSVNYEQTLTAMGRARVQARIGIGTIHLRDFTSRINPDILVPIGIMLTDRHRWNPEAGGGFTLTSVVYPDDADFGPRRRGDVQFWLCAGVRYTPSLRGWLFRAAYTPIIEFDEWRHWGGLSIGRII